MNKAITDGLALMPPPFSAGLDRWSSGDGTPGSPSYDGAPNAALVTADADFGGCLELQKTDGVQRLRHFGQTPILPGCYLRVTARVKAMSGNLPSVRIAAWAGGAGGNLSGVPQTGPSVELTAYGAVVTVSAIIGTGSRGGVDMPWGTAAIFAHVGLDLTGPNNGVVRIDDIVVEDITSAFHRDMMDWVDVRDYGAVGDGVADDRAAFLAADAAAQGRQILVPAGSYFIGANITLNAPVRFEGTLTMAPETRLQLTRSFDFPSYEAAFGSSDLGLRKAIQALFHFTDHVVLDLRGRRVRVDAPIDLAALAGGQDTFEQRRLITNGLIDVQEGPAWDTLTQTRAGTYTPSQPRTLSGVSNVADIPVGSRVTGNGVGREIYVTERNVGAGSLTLSQPLFNAEGTQIYTFTRYRYLFDFSGFAQVSKFEMSDMEWLLKGEASGLMLPPEGVNNWFAGLSLNRPRDRGFSSIGRGCQGLVIEHCNFISNEMPLRSQDRTTVAINVNANDARIHANRGVRFGTFCVLAGTGHLLSDNHFYQGDNEAQGIRQAGLVLTHANVKTTINGNYIDNSFIEWTNEHTSDPSFVGFSFGGLTIAANIFTVNGVAPWFRWLVVKPYGPGQFINGLNISGNVFRTINGQIERVDLVDTTYATLNPLMCRNVVVQGNAFNGVQQVIHNPVTIRHDQNSAAGAWTVNVGPFLPFDGAARFVTSVVALGEITGPGGQRRSDMPFTTVLQGSNSNQVRLNWLAASQGSVMVTARMDNPV